MDNLGLPTTTDQIVTAEARTDLRNREEDILCMFMMVGTSATPACHGCRDQEWIQVTGNGIYQKNDYEMIKMLYVLQTL